MKRWWWVLAVLVSMTGCEEEAEEVDPPEAVAPVEVTGADGAEGETDVAALQARIQELEAQAAERDGPSAGTAEPTPVGGTQVAAVPVGADTPAEGSEAAPSTAGSRSTGGGSSSRRGSTNTTTPDGLLGALLGGPNGTSGRRGSSNDDEEEGEDDGNSGGGRGGSLNPVDVLLGQ